MKKKNRQHRQSSVAKKPQELLAISYEALAKFAVPEEAPRKIKYEIKPPVLPPGVVPAVMPADMAMDDAGIARIYAYARENYFGEGFPGYPYLAELTQRSEYRSPSETTATEMTRKWIKIVSRGTEDVAAKIKEIESAFTHHKVCDIFRKAAEQDGLFGRSQIYIDIKGHEGDEKRQMPLVISPQTIKKGDLRGFKVIEALWTAPGSYNTTDPTSKDFFAPTSWFILGKITHASRLITMIGREVPDMLKPAYNFGGISMTQLMEPYVNAWLRTRQSVSDLIHSFSISGLKTNMMSTLAGGGAEDLFKRAQLFNQIRDNRGLMLLDFNEEEFFQFNTPLSGLDKLQAQAQEHMAAPSHTPLVKLLGVTPTGLNASSEGEIAVYYDYIRAQQENLFTDPLQKVLRIVQLDLFGEIDDSITFEFQPLMEPDTESLSRIRKSDSDAGVAYINAGVISQEEERKRLASDPSSGYNGLDVTDVPEQSDGGDDPAGDADEEAA